MSTPRFVFSFFLLWSVPMDKLFTIGESLFPTQGTYCIWGSNMGKLGLMIQYNGTTVPYVHKALRERGRGEEGREREREREREGEGEGEGEGGRRTGEGEG